MLVGRKHATFSLSACILVSSLFSRKCLFILLETLCFRFIVILALMYAESFKLNHAHAPTDVQQEKTHNALLEGVEGFQADQLKKTETQEKNRLPSPAGNTPIQSLTLLNTSNDSVTSPASKAS